MDGSSLAVVASIVLVFAALSRRLERTVLTAPIVFVTCGYLAGGDVFGWINLHVGSSGVRALAEVTLSLMLFVDASRIDIGALRREIGLPVRLLGIGLPLTIAAGALLGPILLGTLTLAEALVLAIVLAPTDAALGQVVVSDRRLPLRIRQALNVESGLNDGICVPLLFIALGIAEAEEGGVTVHSAVRIVLEEIGFGLGAGIAAGAVAALALGFASRHHLITGEWRQVIPLAAVALAYGIADAHGGSGFVAAFIGGLVFGELRGVRSGEPMFLTDELGGLLNAATFVVFGAALLGPALGSLDASRAAYVVVSLTIVRMLPVALALIGSGARRSTVLYLGWFGPRGLASIVFAVIVLEGSKLDHVHLIVSTVVLTVAASVYAHGLTARPLTDVYVRWFSSHPEPPEMESTPTREHRLRRPVLPTRS
jgi:NhaP-type Na+/H+ or K+/H+ antiporter